MNNAARSDSVGSVNGISTSLAAFARVMGPVIGTSIYAWSSNLDWYYPFNYMFTFHMTILFSIVCLVISFFIPPYLNRNRNTK